MRESIYGTNYYTESIGTGYLSCPVGYRTLADAERLASVASMSAIETRVWDNTGGPVGVLVCVYVRGVRYERAS